MFCSSDWPWVMRVFFCLTQTGGGGDWVFCLTHLFIFALQVSAGHEGGSQSAPLKSVKAGLEPTAHFSVACRHEMLESSP